MSLNVMPLYYFISEISVEITDAALDKLVRNYCRESGVRSLEKHIEKIARKIAFNTVETQEEVNGDKPIVATAEEKAVEAKLSERTNAAIFGETHGDSLSEVGQEETANFNTPSTKNSDVVIEDIIAKKIIVNVDNLEVYVGKARFNQDTIYDSAGASLPPGVVMGLAWNPLVSHLLFLPFSLFVFFLSFFFLLIRITTVYL
jgi:ATP-dependent Lon protease